MYLCTDNYRTVLENRVTLTELSASSRTVPILIPRQLTCPADPEADRRPPVHSSSRTSRTRAGSVPSGSGASLPGPASPAWTDRRWRTRWRSDCILLGGRKDLSSAISEELHSDFRSAAIHGYLWCLAADLCQSAQQTPAGTRRRTAPPSSEERTSLSTETAHLKKRDLQAAAASFRRGQSSTARIQSQRWLTFTWICGT